MFTKEHVGRLVWNKEGGVVKITHVHEDGRQRPIEDNAGRTYMEGGLYMGARRWGRDEGTGHPNDLSRFLNAQELTEHLTTDELVQEICRRHGDVGDIIRDILHDYCGENIEKDEV